MILSFSCSVGSYFFDKSQEPDRIARNGIIISPAKFEFCAREIEFSGFRITWNGVKPLAKYLDTNIYFFAVETGL